VRRGHNQAALLARWVGSALDHDVSIAGAAEVHVWAAARTPHIDSENAVAIGQRIDPLESPSGIMRVRR
jgi:hypothetical protein